MVMTIELLELIDHFTTSYTHTPSTLGNQLQGIELESEKSYQFDSDPIGKIEGNLHQAELFRAAAKLREDGPPVDGKWGRVYPALSKVRDNALRNGGHWKMGELVSCILRDYQEFGVRDPARGLTTVSRRLHSINPSAYPEGSTGSLQASKEAYADAYLATDSFLKRFNDQAKK
jgi:hypothetical protein